MKKILLETNPSWKKQLSLRCLTIIILSNAMISAAWSESDIPDSLGDMVMVPQPKHRSSDDQIHAKTANDALNCTPSSKSNKKGKCPYVSQVYKGDKIFRKAFDTALKTSGITDAPSGPETPMEPIAISTGKYISGSICEAHNCGKHRIDFLYSAAHKNVMGIYQPDGERRRWFGNPNELEKETLLELTK